MRVICLLFLNLLLVGVVVANDEKALPDSPKPKPEVLNVTRQQLVERSVLNRRVFLAGVFALAASKTADAVTTRILLNNGGKELNPVFGKHPSASRQAVTNLGFFATQVGVFYLTEHNKNKYVRLAGRLWISSVVAQHSYLAVCNSKLDPHGTKSCPSFIF